MQNIIKITNLSKVYKDGFRALDNINLTIHDGEIFALLGANGAGKTTLLGIIAGIITKTEGSVHVMGKDIIDDYRFTRSLIGLVPQEASLDPFLPVGQSLRYQRGFYGKPADADLIERTLKQLSLWKKRETLIHTLSGGMKRRVLIAKALMNEPKILFLDEPTAGVDVELRKDMWNIVRTLKAGGTTIILTTHYIEEAEEMADRIGIIDKGMLGIIERKDILMKKFGTKKMSIVLSTYLKKIPDTLSMYNLIRENDGTRLTYTYTKNEKTGIAGLLTDIKQAGLVVHDITTQESSLEEIFVTLTTK